MNKLTANLIRFSIFTNKMFLSKNVLSYDYFNINLLFTHLLILSIVCKLLSILIKRNKISRKNDPLFICIRWKKMYISWVGNSK